MARVLVVEDDEDIRRLVVTRIKASGHNVLAAATGEEALQLIAEKGAPDVAVLDVGLPGIKGTELLLRLREMLNQPGLPAIFLSALVGREDIEAGRALGATYLTKPVIASALLTAIKVAVPQESRGW